MSQAMSLKGEMTEWRKEFDKLETNFDCVFFIMKALECFNKGEKGIKVLGLPPTKEANELLTNGKSDAIAKKCMSISDKFYRDHDLMSSLVALNRAYFSAVSKEVKFDILLKRLRLIKSFGVDEALEEELANVLKNKTTDESTQTVDSLRNDIEGIIDLQVCQGHWICSHPDVPESLTGKAFNNTKMQEDKVKFLPVDILGSQSTSLKTGLKVVASRDISIGEIIFSEEPYASVLNRPYSSLCYNCYKRCINIHPCQGCAYVGFCSQKCADDARNSNRPLNGGSGRHVHDCNGMLPCLRLDDLFDESYRFTQGLTHLVFICVANTPKNVLLDNICASDINKKQQDYVFTENYFVPKSSDYSFLAFKNLSINTIPKDALWQGTVIAVFLTYCLSIAGYPMKWFDEAKEHFYSKPSPLNQPDWLPASWIAARIISHVLMNDFNVKEYTEYYEEKGELFSNANWIANCFYPTISLINHDCNPTACIVNTANGGAFLYALRPVKEGERISVSYGDYYFANSSSDSRRAFLRSTFIFSCSCEACRNDWCLKERDFEILKCPLCESSFKSIRDKCLSCKKANGYLMFQKILHEKIPFLLNALKYDSGVGRESTSEVISVMDDVQRLISSPSPTVAFVMCKAMQFIDRTCGIRFTLFT
ncbi:unnamed protein product [Hymenolepis diminuta]|uniref:SET domain-containing protein n=1 Tax=Hymenolepis diminuta TaxID=6216 RepID=A0A3P6W3I3_HYMDI|nr:unnamed protein product [Hymenolepis diminuta]